MVYNFNLLKIFLMSDEAVTALEYAMIGVLIAVVIIGAVQIVGEKVFSLYDKVASSLPS